MADCDRERVARLFDDIARADLGSSENAAETGTSIPALAGRVAFEKLELRPDDVLLDVGTGTGDIAIAAACICRQVIGIDVSRTSLDQARIKAKREHLDNVIFSYGAFEDPCAELDLSAYDITKILAVYSLHHLPDPMKKQSLLELTGLLHRPGRMVIGDIMFFDDPDKHRDRFDEAGYDEGDTDFPSRAEYLRDCLEQTGARVQVERVHPIVGVVIADFA
ncbi:MAG: class I SAM-dependent methyltransferase [Dehalococcoidia bacterium]